MIGATGFTLIRNGTLMQDQRAQAALAKALSHFPDLKTQSFAKGGTTLTIWGRNALLDSVHSLPDGSLLALIGTPNGKLSWDNVEKDLTAAEWMDDFRLPWDGRVILVHVTADGTLWKLWNDWLGSIPVYYSNPSEMRIASTLEPVVVAASDFGSNGIDLAGLIFLLVHGNFLADWTLYQDMRTVRPDSVTTFDNQGCRRIACRTVTATDTRWERGWDDLVDEMHVLVEKAICQTLQTQPRWIVPLSSGLDSRLIAAVGANVGSDMRTYTWGPATTRDGVCSRQIASVLNLPWERVDLGVDYLVRCLPLWVDLFGSSMHFHGMYQLPFLETLRDTPAAPILSGLIGEFLAGYDVHFQSEFHHTSRQKYVVHPSSYTFWTVNELKNLFHGSIAEALEKIDAMIEVEKNAIEGPWYQKLRFLTLWGRQNHFTYFQSMLSDYCRGVATPYINRAYARFCLSLPRAVLEDRRLQIDMMRRFYPNVMRIGGTYGAEPALLTGRYLLKRRASQILPSALVKRLLPEFTATKNIQTDIHSLQACGREALWPISETRELLADWIDVDAIEQVYCAALDGDMHSVRKLQSLQTFAYRLTER